MASVRLPAGCGKLLNDPLLFNPYQDDFMRKRRLRFCLNCKTVGSMDENGRFVCGKCQQTHVDNLTAPRLFDRFLLLAGRGGGKTLIGAHAVREELMIPGSLWWVMGATYKLLHDSTFPTLVGLIDPQWVSRWDVEHMELTLKNESRVAFRSLEDPDRARGPHGVAGGWFDEAAQCPERAYDVFEPTLIKSNGIVLCTTTVLGFDWTYDKIEKRAETYKEPGYYSRRYWTEENPLFKANPNMMRQIDRAKKTMSPEFFAQEYRAERRNAQGLIYNYKLIEDLCLRDDEAIKRFIPEWPKIDPSRKILIGLDSGADHPFGAVLIVVTDKGLVVVRDYLERGQAISQHLGQVQNTLMKGVSFQDITWSANKNEKNLRLEWGLKGISIVPAESKHEIGIQRVQSWMYSRKLFFAYTASRTIEQLQAYRNRDNTNPTTGEKKKEQVFKLKDELPDAVRYALMAWPELPDPTQSDMTDDQQRRWDAMDARTQDDIIRVREFNKRQKDHDLGLDDEGYPLGDFFGQEVSGIWD